MSKKAIIYRILTGLFAAGFLVAAIFLVRYLIRNRQVEDQYEELAASTNVVSTSDLQTSTPTPDLSAVADSDSGNASAQEQDTSGETAAEDSEGTEDTETEPKLSAEEMFAALGIEIPDKVFDWDALYAINSDIYAWIYIPDTTVDYPIVQSADEADYYLTHNLDHSSGRPGCIYTQFYNSKDFQDKNTVIYGHNITSSGTMFANLHYFEDEDFFEDHPYFYIYTPEGALIYEIYAAVAFSNVHILGTYNFNSYFGYAKFIKAVDNSKRLTNHWRDIELTNEDHLVTLSTCIKGESDMRYIVVGVLIDEDKAASLLEDAESSDEAEGGAETEAESGT